MRGVRGVAAIAGLAAEAAAARRAGVALAAAGVGPQAAGALARQFAAGGATGLVSFGVAGALAPGLAPGTLILGDAVIGADAARYPCDLAWLARAAGGLPQARVGLVAASERIVAGRHDKAVLAASGAIAVDMESGTVARVAREYGLPFLVLRAVADRAEDEIPEAAAAALLSGGAAFAIALARRPAVLPVLVRLGWHTAVALRALGRAAERLGPDLALA